MFCTKCGAQIRDGVQFCTSCGAKIGAGQQEEQHESTPAKSVREALAARANSDQAIWAASPAPTPASAPKPPRHMAIAVIAAAALALLLAGLGIGKLILGSDEHPVGDETVAAADQVPGTGEGPSEGEVRHINPAQAYSRLISAGGSHSVAVRYDGSVVAIGSDADGQCDVSD